VRIITPSITAWPPTIKSLSLVLMVLNHCDEWDERDAWDIWDAWDIYDLSVSMRPICPITCHPLHFVAGLPIQQCRRFSPVACLDATPTTGVSHAGINRIVANA
jgi:hypothetical protein